jgi:hypothetical protein
MFERRAAPLGRTAQQDDEGQFFGAAHQKNASPIVIVSSKICQGRVSPQTAFFGWSVVPTWLPRPQPGMREAFPARSAPAG